MSDVLSKVDSRTQLAGHNRLEILMFRLNGKQLFGINVFKIQEVIQCPTLTHIANAHPVVRGIANMRGQTIPIMDLSMSIGQGALPEGDGGFIIITEFNRSVQGFLVDSVDRIVNMNWEDILPPPKGTGKQSYLTAVTRVDGALIEIIDVEKVLAEVIGTEDVVSDEIVEAQKEQIIEVTPHILVADDSSVARNQIKRTLDQIGVEYTVCNDGRQALDQLEDWLENEPEKVTSLAMVLSDVEMPEMDGYTLTTNIRNNPGLQHLYVLLHTSLSGVFNSAMIEKVGANMFVAKFAPDKLAEAVLQQVNKEE